jgi:hypothetical protein
MGARASKAKYESRIEFVSTMLLEELHLLGYCEVSEPSCPQYCKLSMCKQPKYGNGSCCK